MKELKVIFWATLSLGALILLASYLSAEGNNISRHTPHYHALQRLNEMARIKHHHSHIHTSFANQAHTEGNNQAERLFRAIAYSEKAQCLQCQKAIKNLGGRFTKPIVVNTEVSSTTENISRAHVMKSHHRTTKSNKMILRSMATGNSYATRILVWCDANDAHQITLLECHLHSPQELQRVYHVCPKCGYLSEHNIPTPICPHCKTPATLFIRF